MKKQISLLLVLLLLLAGCGTERKAEETEKLIVVTSFYPVYLLAQAATEGTTGIELKNMAQPQTGCLHDYELTISDMKRLEGADVLLINGGGMESFLTQAMERYPELTVIDTSKGVALLKEEGHHHHGEETEESHSAEGNPHLWLSPARAAAQVETIAEELGKRNQAEQAVLLKNADAFRKEAEALQREAAAIGLPQETYAAVFHEGFAYLAELFGMQPVCSIFADEYQIPSAKELAEATEEAKLHGVQFFLTADDTGKTYARTIAEEMEQSVLILDPLTTGEDTPRSYLERMEENIRIIDTYWKERTR